MPKKVLCVFAHPDDESFCTGGTLALWARQGVEIHLLCVTKGDSGKIPEIRTQELQKCSEVLGIKSVEFLDYKDGFLSNKTLKELESIILNKITQIQPDTLLTLDFNGVTGHIDHIVVSSATHQAFKKNSIAQYLYCFVQTKEYSDAMTDYFIYYPEGRNTEDIDVEINIESAWDTKVKAMEMHKSAKADSDIVIELLTKLGKKEYFIVKTK